MGLGLAFGLLFRLVALLPELETHNGGQRNYELDFLKLIFALCVFVWHTDPFRNERIQIVFPLAFGGVPVHFFFVVSGMMMARSILKRQPETTEYGKLAMVFVVNKIKALAWDVYAALFIFMSVYTMAILHRRKNINKNYGLCYKNDARRHIIVYNGSKKKERG